MEEREDREGRKVRKKRQGDRETEEGWRGKEGAGDGKGQGWGRGADERGERGIERERREGDIGGRAI